MDEVEAAKALKKGDRAVSRYFFERYYDRLIAYITTYTRDKLQSEDIVQEAFINLWKDRDKLDPTKSPKSYLYAIAYNRCIDSLEKAPGGNMA
ncbi:sigma-70 family RNA polymerase sigma factor [Fulvivirga sp. M361]|uniref:sigma-70 family RNA polymerase sigma factor n=1 Tax=Fulvivirga sp. M361 TaxID=2594266 RepID=UPI00117A1CDC|nr:sigma-70 family RNA polymerase sigma factor [Fulvivirga sp. M361]TRX54307.1 sigma-70 family RNA polymerase sigma factor [Fulvivirga sp. M361]